MNESFTSGKMHLPLRDNRPIPFRPRFSLSIMLLTIVALALALSIVKTKYVSNAAPTGFYSDFGPRLRQWLRIESPDIASGCTSLAIRMHTEQSVEAAWSFTYRGDDAAARVWVRDELVPFVEKCASAHASRCSWYHRDDHFVFSGVFIMQYSTRDKRGRIAIFLTRKEEGMTDILVYLFEVNGRRRW